MQFSKYAKIFFGILVFRAAFSLYIGYVDDDAYHWSWSRELALSYYDHPGMIAWLEALSTAIFGVNKFGIRLPSFLCYVGVIVLIFQLAKSWFDERAAAFASAVVLFTPIWGFGGFVSSPEMPFMLFWLLAIWVFWQSIRQDEKKWSVKKTWLALGLLMGLGLNSKFPMALLAPAFGIYLLISWRQRKDLLTPWPWVGILIAAVLCAPIFIWNIQYDWPGFRYQFHERHTGRDFDLQRWVGYLGMQLGMLTPTLWFGILSAFVVSFRRLRDPRWLLMFSVFLPSFLIFYPQPLWADFKPHWMGPAYFVMSIGAAELFKNSRIYKFLLLLFLIPINIAIYVPTFYPFVPKVVRAIGNESTWELKNDVSNELFGWPELGQYALSLQKQLEVDQGRRPLMGSHRYETTAQTYLATLQKTYMLNTPRSHYTVTQNLEEVRGQDFLFVTTDKYPGDPLKYAKFDYCYPYEFKYYRADELSRIFTLHYCTNFQGVIP